jgi:hypothetical protein
MSEEPRTDEELEEFVKQMRIRDQRHRYAMANAAKYALAMIHADTVGLRVVDVPKKPTPKPERVEPVLSRKERRKILNQKLAKR